MRPIQRLHKQDDNIFNRFVDNVRETLNALIQLPLLQGVYIDASLVTGSNTVPHSLDRVPNGYLVVKNDTGATIYQTSLTTTQIVLQASAAVNVKLYVF